MVDDDISSQKYHHKNAARVGAEDAAIDAALAGIIGAFFVALTLTL